MKIEAGGETLGYAEAFPRTSHWMVKDVSRTLGRPRNASLDEAILQSALTEIAAQGLKNFSIARVAERAGVARGTVYLRWKDRETLILDAIRTTGVDFVRPHGASLRDNLAVVVRQWAVLYRNPERRKLYARLDAEEEEFPDIVDEFRSRMAYPANEIIEELLLEAQMQGYLDLHVPPVVVARCLVGSLRLQARLSGGSIDDEFESALVDFLLSGLRQDRPLA